MATEHLLPPTPEEALHAFMDGELGVAHEQQLFDELASNADLRTEMKDVLTLRKAVIHDLVAPPADAELGLMSAVGFAVPGATMGAGASAAAGAAVGTASAGGSLFTILVSASSLIAGFVIAWLLFTNVFGSSTKTDTIVTGARGSSGTLPPTSAENFSPELHATIVAPTDTVVAVRYRTAPRTNSVQPNSAEPKEVNNEVLAYQQAPDASASMSNSQAISSITTSNAITYQVTSARAATSVDATARPSALTTIAVPQNQVYLRVRTLASGLQRGETTPASIENAVLPNSSFALLFPLSQHHRLGAEMGTESFKQQFTTTDEHGKQLNVMQMPVLYWLGTTYEYRSNDFNFLGGLSAFAIATVGYAYSQGPLGRATLGLSYQPVGPLRLYFGFDASSLAYHNENNWFTSNKWGLSYGLSFDLGSL